MKHVAFVLVLNGLAFPAMAGSDGQGSRYFDPYKISTWTTCAQEDVVSGTDTVCAPKEVGDLLQSYTQQPAK